MLSDADMSTARRTHFALTIPLCHVIKMAAMTTGLTTSIQSLHRTVTMGRGTNNKDYLYRYTYYNKQIILLTYRAVKQDTLVRVPCYYEGNCEENSFMCLCFQ